MHTPHITAGATPWPEPRAGAPGGRRRRRGADAGWTERRTSTGRKVHIVGDREPRSPAVGAS